MKRGGGGEEGVKSVVMKIQIHFSSFEANRNYVILGNSSLFYQFVSVYLRCFGDKDKVCDRRTLMDSSGGFLEEDGIQHHSLVEKEEEVLNDSRFKLAEE